MAHTSSLISYQTKIQVGISRYLDTLKASRNSMGGQDSRGQVYGLLCMYHNMAAIMADACLCLDDEFVFDSHTERFISILNTAVVLWKTGLPDYPARPLPWPRIYMSRSIVDIGWIAPLYYTALKCRVHRVRLQAIRLMETASYREGMWDSKIASCVARRVMEIEEGELFKDSRLTDEFSLCSSPRIQDLSLPMSLQLNRICEVCMPLTDGPTNPIILSYRHAQTVWKDTLIFTSSDEKT